MKEYQAEALDNLLSTVIPRVVDDKPIDSSWTAMFFRILPAEDLSKNATVDSVKLNVRQDLPHVIATALANLAQPPMNPTEIKKDSVITLDVSDANTDKIKELAIKFTQHTIKLFEENAEQEAKKAKSDTAVQEAWTDSLKTMETLGKMSERYDSSRQDALTLAEKLTETLKTALEPEAKERVLQEYNDKLNNMAKELNIITGQEPNTDIALITAAKRKIAGIIGKAMATGQEV